jgi:hypothetical protein
MAANKPVVQHSQILGQTFVIAEIGSDGTAIRIRADEVMKYIIEPVAEYFNLAPVRSDRDATPGQITPRIVKLILDSDVVIADLTGQNANVYYELAVAHAFRLPVVILVDNVKSLSFDAKDERVIQIGDSGTISASQAEQAKNDLHKAMEVVLGIGYKPSSLVTQVAETQSLAKLAPANPVAAEIGRIKERLDQIARSISTIEARLADFSSNFRAGGAFTGWRDSTITAQPVPRSKVALDLIEALRESVAATRGETPKSRPRRRPKPSK